LGFKRKWNFCTKKRSLVLLNAREMSSSATTAGTRKVHASGLLLCDVVSLREVNADAREQTRLYTSTTEHKSAHAHNSALLCWCTAASALSHQHSPRVETQRRISESINPTDCRSIQKWICPNLKVRSIFKKKKSNIRAQHNINVVPGCREKADTTNMSFGLSSHGFDWRSFSEMRPEPNFFSWYKSSLSAGLSRISGNSRKRLGFSRFFLYQGIFFVPGKDPAMHSFDWMQPWGLLLSRSLSLPISLFSLSFFLSPTRSLSLALCHT